MAIHEVVSSPWVWIGLAILLILSTVDFFQRVRRATSQVRFAVALVFFLAINAVIYVALVVVFVTNPVLLLTDDDGSSSASVAPLIPILTAFLYFGAGSSNWKIMGAEIDIYEKLVSLANDALGFRIYRAEVRKEIFAHTTEYERLRSSLENLHAAIDEREQKTPDCERLTEEWKALMQDFALIKGHIDDLMKIRETIESNQNDRALELLQTMSEDREAVLRKELIDRLKSHLYSFIVVRAKTKEDVRKMLESIPDAEGRWKDIEPVPLFDKPLPHAIVVGVFFGIFVGLLAARFPSGDPFTTPWIGAAACGVFAGIFHLTMKTDDLSLSGLVGAAAGLAGFLVWATLNSYVVPSTDHAPVAISEIFLKSIVGVLYGGVSGLIIHFFRSHVCPRTVQPWLRTLAIAAMGATAFFSIRAFMAWFFPELPQIERTTQGLFGMILMAVIGAVFLVGLANACKLLRPSDSDRPVSAESG